MTTKKITQLTELTNPVNADVLPIHDSVTISTKKISWLTIKTLFAALFAPKNTAITAATKTKITYDSNGLVTAGADATTADIAASTNKNYVTDAQAVVIGNTSGTNSGNETVTTIGALINGATSKTAPVNNDMIGLMDSEASNVVKRLSWGYVKANLKSYFDSYYLSRVATTAAISDSTDRRYCTDAQKTVISNTSGTNSGDETVTTIGALISGATSKTAPADNDMIGLMDSGASNVVKKLSWAYVKSALKTYFDTLYGSPRYKNCSTAQQTGFSSETYLDGSCVTIPAGSIVAGSYYKCVFDISKTAAGTGSLIIKVWAGTTGTTSDTCLRSTIFAPGTAAADSGRAIVEILFRTGGSSATGRSLMTIFHDLAAAGLTTKGIASYSISVANLSSATKIGVSLKGGESFAGTVELVSAEFVP